VECGWVDSDHALADWLQGVLYHSLTTLELPILLRLVQALENNGDNDFIHWCDYLLASRETSELRKEERQRGAAMAVLLPKLAVDIPAALQDATRQTQLAGFALAAHQWQIDAHSCCAGYLWSWLENQVMAGVKLVPLGQTQGQQLLLKLSEQLPHCVEQAMTLDDSQIASSTPALAIASSRHETQYTRLFRS
jgi:urease accessory protein